jgi:hypothetical protein
MSSPVFPEARGFGRHHRDQGCLHDFFTLWQDADAGVDLKEAKAEHAKLH